MPQSLKKVLSGFYDELSTYIEEYDRFPLDEIKSEGYKPTLIAAFIKCYEFNRDINKLQAHRYSFYFTSFLRGICEDLISLKFLKLFTIEQRTSIIWKYNSYLLMESLAAQKTFFNKEKPFQAILKPDKADLLLKKATEELYNMWISLGHKKDKPFPNVKQMATDAKLIALYNYLYHATSRTVHFSPNVLLRTGWYDQKGGPIIFSTKNFHKYYTAFNSIYGSLLFIHFINSFKRELGLKKPFLKVVKGLEDYLNRSDWPEIITYEELNLKRPNKIPQIIMEVMAQMKKEEREEFIKLMNKVGEKNNKSSPAENN